MPTLSLCMIVKNEEFWLPKCIAAAMNFVDEIVIADTGSADNTVAIAQSFGAKVSSVSWEHDFAKARNSAIAMATKDWILVLDADEFVDEADFKKIKDLLETTSAGAFRLEIRNYVNAQGAGCISCTPSEITKGAAAYRAMQLVRLFRNKQGFCFEGRVHETVDNSIKLAGGKVEPASVVVHHYGIFAAENLQHKMRYYAWLVFKDLEVHPENARALFMAGQFMQERGKLEQARAYFQRSAALNPSYKNVWFSIANTFLQQQKHEEAMHAYEQSLLHNPDSPNAPRAINNLAVLYASAGRKKDATTLLTLGVKKYPSDAAIRKNAERFGIK